MAGPVLQQFRQRFPQYNEVSDDDLARHLHNRFPQYKAIPFDTFRAKLELGPGFEEPKKPSVMDRVAGIFAERDAKPEQVLSPNPKNESAIVEQMAPADPPAAPEDDEKGSSLGAQIYAAWNEYRANWNTMTAVRSVRQLGEARAEARGQPQPNTGGILGVTGGDIARQARAVQAEAGSIDAARGIERDTQENRRKAVRKLQQAIDNRVQLIAKNRGIQPSQVTRRFLASDSFAAAGGEFVSDPITVMLEVAASSAPNLVDSITMGAAGALLGGPIGLALGAGSGSAMVEYRSSFAEALTAEGIDISNAESLIDAVHDQSLMSRVNRKAATRAGLIGAFDAASAGVATKTLTPMLKNVVARTIANQVAQTGAQGALGAAGEAAAQLATEGRVSAGQVLAEAVGEGVTAVAEVGGATVSGLRQQSINAGIEQAQAELGEILGRRPDEPGAVPSTPIEEQGVATEVVPTQPIEEAESAPLEVVPREAMEDPAPDSAPVPGAVPSEAIEDATASRTSAVEDISVQPSQPMTEPTEEEQEISDPSPSAPARLSDEEIQTMFRGANVRIEEEGVTGSIADPMAATVFTAVRLSGEIERGGSKAEIRGNRFMIPHAELEAARNQAFPVFETPEEADPGGSVESSDPSAGEVTENNDRGLRDAAEGAENIAPDAELEARSEFTEKKARKFLEEEGGILLHKLEAPNILALAERVKEYQKRAADFTAKRKLKNQRNFGTTGKTADYVKFIEDESQYLNDPAVDEEAVYKAEEDGGPYVVRTVNLSSIETDQDTVTGRVVGSLTADERPVGVPQSGGRVQILDGNHRVVGAVLAGLSTIEVDLYAGPEVDSVLAPEEIAFRDSGQERPAPTPLMQRISPYSGPVESVAPESQPQPEPSLPKRTFSQSEAEQFLRDADVDLFKVDLTNAVGAAIAVQEFQRTGREYHELNGIEGFEEYGHTADTADYIDVVPEDAPWLQNPKIDWKKSLDEKAPKVVRRVRLSDIQTDQEIISGRLEGRMLASKRPVGAPQAGGKVQLFDGNHRVVAAVLAGQETIDVELYAGSEVDSVLTKEEIAFRDAGRTPMAPQPLLQQLAVSLMPVRRAISIDNLEAIEKGLGIDARDATVDSVSHALKQKGIAVYVRAEGVFDLGANSQAEMDAAVELAKATAGSYGLRTPLGEVNGIGIAGAKTGTILEARQPVLDMKAGAKWTPNVGQTGTLPIDAQNDIVLGNGRRVRIPETPIRREHILARMQVALGNRIYQGRVKGPKTRLGFYRKGQGEIRIRNANDLETAAHEVGHWLDENRPWISDLYTQPAMGTELRSISYDSESAVEGFAEFFRLYMTHESEAMARAPGFYEAFTRRLRRDTQLGPVVDDIQEMTHAWLIQGAKARLESKHDTDKVTLFERIREHIKIDWRQKALDGLRSIREIELDVTDGRTTEAYNKARLAVGGLNGVIEAAFFYGTPSFREDGQGLQFSGKSLKSVFGNLWGDRDLGLYMIARRGQELAQQGRENLLRADEIQAGLSLAQDNPRFAQVFDEYQAFNQRMLDFAQEAGILSEKSRAAIEEMNKSYVPFYRVMESMVEGREVRNAGSPFRRLKGGDRNINSVWENIVNNMSTIIQNGLLNDAKKTLYERVSQAENQQGGLYAAPIEPSSQMVSIRTEEVVRKLASAMGMTQRQYQMAKNGMGTPQEQAAVEVIDRMLDGSAEMIDMFVGQMAPTGSVDSYMVDGDRKYMEIGDRALWDSIKFMGPRSTNLALLVLGGASNLLRRGVTSLPIFQGRNFVRDTTSAWLLTKRQRVPAVPALRSVFSRYSQDPMYQDMLLNGGGFAGRAQGLMETHGVHDPRSWVAAYDRFMSRFEDANRLAEFRAAINQGASPREAALASREISTDFAMRGSSQVMRTISVAVPFLNARMQGMYGLARFSTDRPHLTSILMRGTALTLATLALYAMNKDDERYEELPDYVRDLNWVFFTGSGESDFVLIPKPFDVGMLFATIPERMFELTEERDGKEFTDSMSWLFWNAFNMDITPQLYAPELDLQRNKDFTGAPIVPPYLENVEPSQQYTYYTSTTARLAADQIGMTPITMDYRIRGYMGTLGTYLLAASDAMIRAASGDVDGTGERPTQGETWRKNIIIRNLAGSQLPEGPGRRTKSLTDFYDLARETEKVARTVSIMQRRHADGIEAYANDPENSRLLALNENVKAAKKMLRGIRTAIDSVRNDAELSGDEKRARIWALTRQRNQAIREIMKAIRPIARQVQ